MDHFEFSLRGALNPYKNTFYFPLILDAINNCLSLGRCYYSIPTNDTSHNISGAIELTDNKRILVKRINLPEESQILDQESLLGDGEYTICGVSEEQYMLIKKNIQDSLDNIVDKLTKQRERKI